MKSFIILFIVVTLLGCGSNDDYFIGNECESSFYYYYDEKIYLDDLNKNYLVIGFNKQTDDNEIVHFINNLDSYESITNKNIFTQQTKSEYKLLFVKFKTEQSCVKINLGINKLNANNIVVFVNKTYNTDLFFERIGYFDLMYTTDEFNIKLKDGIGKSQLDSLIFAMGSISIIEESELSSILMSNSSKIRNTIETSNLFYESGLFEYSEPNFGYIQF